MRTYYKRQFLNAEEHGGMACVEATVHEASGSGARAGVEATLSISDGNRTVNLDFGVYGPDDIDNHLLKIRRLLTAIRAFEAALREQYDDVHARSL